MRWQRLADLLQRIEAHGAQSITAAEARETTQLHRAASADLLAELRRDPDARTTEYLRSLVARAHGMLHRGAPPRVLAAVGRFFARDFPETVRRRIRPVLLATLIFLAGSVFGAIALSLDPGTGEVLLVLGNRGLDPRERVRHAEKESTPAALPDHALGGAHFAGELFQNNAKVTFLEFALAATGGIGTALLLFANGAYLGAVALKYLAAGEGLFLVAWIGPHGVLEIPAILLGGGAAFLVAKALFIPGLAGRSQALRECGRDALTILLGATATLLVAGLIEGTFSQMHEPLVPYPLKIAFAAVVGSAYALYLFVAWPDVLARRRASAGRAHP